MIPKPEPKDPALPVNPLIEKNCPCTRDCPRHGDCFACAANHRDVVTSAVPYCLRKRSDANADS